MKKIFPLLVVVLLVISGYIFAKPYLTAKKFFAQEQSYTFELNAPEEVTSLLENAASVKGEFVQGRIHAKVVSSDETELIEVFRGEDEEIIVNLTPMVVSFADGVSDKLSGPLSKLLSSIFDGDLYISLTQVQELTGSSDSSGVLMERYNSIFSYQDVPKSLSPKFFYKGDSERYKEQLKDMKFVSLKSGDGSETIVGFHFLAKNAVSLYVKAAEGGELYFPEVKYSEGLNISIPMTIDESIIESLKPILTLFSENGNDTFKSFLEQIDGLKNKLIPN